MRIVATSGVVGRTVATGNSDLIVGLLTRDLGSIDAVARGARGSRRRFGPALGLLVLANHHLKQSASSLWTLEGSDVLQEWTTLASSVVSFAHATYGLELARELFPTAEPQPQVVPALVALWDDLVEHGPTAARLRAYELHLLQVLGVGLSVAVCSACEGVSELNWFEPAGGGALCADCRKRTGSLCRPYSAGARDYLLQVLAPTVVAAQVDAAVDPRDRTMVRELIHAAIAGHIGRPLKSMEFLRKLR